MRKIYIVRLTEEERTQLEEMTRKGKAAAYKLTHARILLQSDQSEQGLAMKDQQIAQNLGVTERSVARVRQRFVEGGLEGAINRKKQVSPSRRPKFDGDSEARLVTLACSTPPEGRGSWTLRLLADKLVELEIFDSVSHETVRQTLKKTNSNPGCMSNGASRRKRTRDSSAAWKTC
jgi:transposase